MMTFASCNLYGVLYVCLLNEFMFVFTEIEICRRIVRISTMAETSDKSVRQSIHFERDECRQVFGWRRRQIDGRRNRTIRLLVS